MLLLLGGGCKDFETTNNARKVPAHGAEPLRHAYVAVTNNNDATYNVLPSCLVLAMQSKQESVMTTAWSHE